MRINAAQVLDTKKTSTGYVVTSGRSPLRLSVFAGLFAASLVAVSGATPQAHSYSDADRAELTQLIDSMFN